MSFRNGDKARSGRLRKKRNQMRLKSRALRAELMPGTAPEQSGGDSGHGVVDHGVVKTVAEKIGSALGTVVAATHLTSTEA